MNIKITTFTERKKFYYTEITDFLVDFKKFYNICTIDHSPTHISSPLYCRHTVSAKMGGSPQRIVFEDGDNLLFLILTKPASDRSMVPSTDPLVCGMDVVTTFIAWNIMPLY